MQQLTSTTKVKLIMPALYFLLSVLLFVFTWPVETKPHHFVGAVVTVMAFAFWMVARWQLGNAFTLAPSAKFIVNDGLYSKLRHPVYYFSILAVGGLTIYSWHILPLMALALLITLEAFRIKKEEAVLTNKFGQEYLDYKKQTWL